MLSEFKCRKCQQGFLVGLKKINSGAPIKHCICCGGDSLEFVGSEAELVVKIEGVIDEYNQRMQ